MVCNEQQPSAPVGNLLRVRRGGQASGKTFSQRTVGGIRLATPDPSGGTTAMLYYALMFLVVGLIAGALGLFGIAAIAGQIAWVLFLIGVILIVVHLISGRRALP
jgi:uncharacterized membrane protein YtjA (UPF0391 family)